MNSLKSKKVLARTRYSIVSLPFLLAVFAIVPHIVFAQASITGFTSHIELHRDGSASVQEEILYDFGDTTSHGIYRDIPLFIKRGDGKEVSVAMTDLSVTDGKNHQIPFAVEGGGNYVKIKIGDPEKIINGSAFYVLRYSLLGIVTEAESKDVFYWNITGDGWMVPIHRARIEVALPEEIPQTDMSYACYHVSTHGVLDCTENTQIGTATGTIAVLRYYKDDMAAHESIIVAAEMPPNVFLLPKSHKAPRILSWWGNIMPSWWLVLPFLLTVFEVRMILQHKKRKRDITAYLIASVALMVASFAVSPAPGLALFASGVVLSIFTIINIQKFKHTL